MKKIIPFLTAFCLIAGAGHAAEYSVMNQASAVTFKLMRGLVWMHGRVFTYDVTFEYTPEDPKSWRVEAEIPLRGIQVVEQGLKDQVLEDGALFKTIEYPTIYFDSSEVVSADKDGAVVRGMLSINGIEKETDVRIHINGQNSFKDDQGPRKVIGIHATATINRQDFDIRWPFERKGRKLRGGSKFGNEIELEFDMIGMEIR